MVEIKYNKKIINGRYHWTFTEGTVGGETWEFMDRLSKKQFLQAVERQKQSRGTSQGRTRSTTGAIEMGWRVEVKIGSRTFYSKSYPSYEKAKQASYRIRGATGKVIRS